MRERAVVVIPTYNEKENILRLLSKILSLNLKQSLSVLVVDDHSPDGTGEVVSSLAQSEKNISLLTREGRRGRGKAGIEGFKEALKLNPDYIIEMDADFSHQPEEIPHLLSEARRNDLVIGSRFVKGGKDINRNLPRRFITFAVSQFIRIYLKIPVRDASSGFRCFRREVLEKIDLDSLKSSGPSIVQEILYKTHNFGFKIKEIPITFKNRAGGETKLTFCLLVETLIFNWKLKKLSSSFPPHS
ncbi:MAG: polyprenol monophosphomannose synthase [Candidatus Aminicenantes bacterium]